MKPEEFAEIANQQTDCSLDQRIAKFLLEASAGEIQRFLRCLHRKNKQRYFQFAFVALDIRIYEEPDLRTRRFVGLIWGLVKSIGTCINPTLPIGLALILCSFSIGVTIGNFGPTGPTSIFEWAGFVGLIVGLVASCIGVALSAIKTVRHLWSHANHKTAISFEL